MTYNRNHRILWVDDEIDALKPHIIHLQEKGCRVWSSHSPIDALELFSTHTFDLVFVDEHMPGMSGIEMTSRIKVMKPNLPIVMVTKSEKESLMEEAIGSRVSDYLIKPITRSQVYLCVKKILEMQQIVENKTNQNYQQEFLNLSEDINSANGLEQWYGIYRKLTHWDLQFSEHSQGSSLWEALVRQRIEANEQFFRFVRKSYLDWISVKDPKEGPTMSHNLLSRIVLPHLGSRKVVLILIDNFRYDQLESIEPHLDSLYKVESKDLYLSLLPTATAYARNSVFSGLLPDEISSIYPQYWVGEDQEGGKNNFEKELLDQYLKLHGFDFKSRYYKILKSGDEKKLYRDISSIVKSPLTVMVFNFVDMLSHARTDTKVVKELIGDESAYRSVTNSWFLYSSLFEILNRISKEDVRIIITSDHGTAPVNKAIQVSGEWNLNANLRYKTGRHLKYSPEEVFDMASPGKYGLPSLGPGSRFIFAPPRGYFIYPQNYNQYVNMYNGTFQHGGISMEEMMVPYTVLENKWS